MIFNGLTDTHCHILPGVDDGSHSLSESIAMMQEEAAQGVTRVIATPHFYANRDTLQCFMARRHEAERVLRQEMERHPDMPELFLGAEVLFFNGISHWEGLEELTLNKSGYLLLEMPFVEWTDAILDEVGELAVKRGITPVFAHVERYLYLFHPKQILDELRRRSFMIQCNADYFIQRNTSRTALKYLCENRIHFMGSDSHNILRRKPNIGEAAEIIFAKHGIAPLERLSQMADYLFDS